MNEPELKWPDYAFVPQTEFVHAIGMVSINFNLLEQSIRWVLSLVIDLPEEPFLMLFNTLDNSSRSSLLRLCDNAGKFDSKLNTSITNFVEGFNVCCKNRNILMHAHVIGMTDDEPFYMFMSKATKRSSKEKTYQPTVADIRKIADDMHRFYTLGLELYSYIKSANDAEKKHTIAVIALPKEITSSE
ncbi:MAG: hypothetical protein HXX10_28705 [Rhodoplanes sp.]|uniref:hypothetical protein n=1 Tax=Rhodoplanes sp. TaxID=1968906 RepID=UPI00184CB9A7|nr:hypothetical protein [Rhodoplanes sp.]NVO18020.1 hypothetical protein [Rhodoplanes sp.]